jgi:hypothetical protein
MEIIMSVTSMIAKTGFGSALAKDPIRFNSRVIKAIMTFAIAYFEEIISILVF